MQKNSKIIILIILISVLFNIVCSASDNIVKLNDLIENSALLNGTEVTVQGEVIGEALERGDYAWININDSSNAIGVWVKQSDIEQIRFYGDYKHKGDIVIITGVFHRACAEHGGDVDIHCSCIKILENGHDTKYLISSFKIIITTILIAAAAVIIMIYLQLDKGLFQRRKII